MANPLLTPLKKLPTDKKLSRAEKGSKPRALNIPQKTIAGNMVFSDSEVWAFYRMQSSQFDFESVDQKARLLHQTSEAYASLLNLNGDSDPIQVFPFTITTPVDEQAYLATSYNPAQALVNPKYDEIMNMQASVIKNAGLPQEESYIGVLLGSRKKFQKPLTADDDEAHEETIEDARKVFTDAMLDELTRIQKYFGALVNIHTENVSRLEELNAMRREKVIRRALRHSTLAAEPLTRDEIMTITKTLLHPGEPPQPLDIDGDYRVGAHEIAYEYAHLIDNSKNTCVAITQEYADRTTTRYVATFTVSQLPEVLEFPQMAPFAEVAGYSVPTASVFARLTIIPNNLMRDALESQTLKHRNEATDIQDGSETVHTYGDTNITALQKAQAYLEDIQAENDAVKAPWVRGSIHIRVYADSIEELKNYFEALKQQYRNQNINLRWTRNNQVELLLSAMPGAGLFVGGTTNNHILAQQFTGYLGLNFSASIGDDFDPRARFK